MGICHVVKNVLRKPVLIGPLESDIVKVRYMSEKPSRIRSITDSESVDHIKYNYDVQYKSDYEFFYQREHQIPPPAWVTDSFMYRMTNEWFKYDYGSKFLPRAQARLRGGNCYIWLDYIINILTIV